MHVDAQLGKHKDMRMHTRQWRSPSKRTCNMPYLVLVCAHVVAHGWRACTHALCTKSCKPAVVTPAPVFLNGLREPTL